MGKYEEEKEILKKEIKTVPNAITALRFLGTLVILPAIFTVGITPSIFLWTAAIAFTDKLDGWYARKYHASSLFGKAFDGLTDKVFSYGLVASLVSIGIIPILNPAISIPFVFTLLRDVLVFDHAFNTKVKVDKDQKIRLVDDFKEKVRNRKTEEKKKLNLRDKAKLMKETMVHKLNESLKVIRENEKKPFVVTRPAKVKMVAQCLSILSFMTIPLGLPYAFSIGTALLWGTAGCAALDLAFMKKNENIISDSKLEPTIVRFDNSANGQTEPVKKLEKSLDYPSISVTGDTQVTQEANTSINSGKQKPRTLVKTLPGRYYRV